MFKLMTSLAVHTVAAIVLLLLISSNTLAQLSPATEAITAANNSSSPASAIDEVAQAASTLEPEVPTAAPVPAAPSPAPVPEPEDVAAPVSAELATPILVASSAPSVATQSSNASEVAVSTVGGDTTGQPSPALPPAAEQSPSKPVSLAPSSSASVSNVNSTAEQAPLPVAAELVQATPNVSEPKPLDVGSQTAISNSSQQDLEKLTTNSSVSQQAPESQVSLTVLPASSLNVNDTSTQASPAKQEEHVFANIASPEVHAEHQQTPDPTPLVPTAHDPLTAARPHAEASTHEGAAENILSTRPMANVATGSPTWALVIVLIALVLSSVFVTIVVGAFFVHKYKARTQSATIND